MRYRLSPVPRQPEYVGVQIGSKSAYDRRVCPDPLAQKHVLIEQIENNGTEVELERAKGPSFEGNTSS